MSESDAHQSFEVASGGPHRAFLLMRIYEETSNPVGGTFPLTTTEKQTKRMAWFRRRAKEQGYTDLQVRLFLELQ